MIAIDASDDGDHVLEAVKELEDRNPADYHVLTAIPPLVTQVAGMDPSANSWSLAGIEQQIAEQAAESVKKRAAAHGISTDRVHLRNGKPSSVIQDFAEEVGADLIVIGSHARKGIARLMLGSTANAVLHGAPCDVLTIRVR